MSADGLAAIAEEMGAVLIWGVYSSHAKERRDCPTAPFDARGLVIAQAEHIPGHLGTKPEAVAAIMAHSPAPGDVFVVNAPHSGRSHLPVTTLVSALAADGCIVGYAVAARIERHALPYGSGGQGRIALVCGSEPIGKEVVARHSLGKRTRAKRQRRTYPTSLGGVS